MTHIINDTVIERANELAEELTSTTGGKIMAEALNKFEKDKDVESLWQTMKRIEGQLAQEHFHNFDLLEDSHVY